MVAVDEKSEEHQIYYKHYILREILMCLSNFIHLVAVDKFESYLSH